MTVHKWNELRDKMSPERKAKIKSVVKTELKKMEKKMKKQTWRKPPKKLYLINEKGYIADYGDVVFTKSEAEKDIRQSIVYGNVSDQRVYEYVLVDRPIKEVKATHGND